MTVGGGGFETSSSTLNRWKSLSNIYIVLIDTKPLKKKKYKKLCFFFFIYLVVMKKENKQKIFTKKSKKRLEILFFIYILNMIIRGDQSTIMIWKTIEILFTYRRKDTRSPDLIVCLFYLINIGNGNWDTNTIFIVHGSICKSKNMEKL